MNRLLEKLDHMAGRWVNTMDEQLQQPIVHTMTGEVFTHGTASNDHMTLAQPVQPAAPAGHKPAVIDVRPTRTAVLRKA
jgi:hypothetical protein